MNFFKWENTENDLKTSISESDRNLANTVVS